MNYIKEFLKEKQAQKNLSNKTIKAYLSDISCFSDYLCNVKVIAATTADIIDYITHLTNNGRKESTIKRKIITLQLFFTYLFDKKVIEYYPFNGFKINYRQERRLPKTLTIKEISALLASLYKSKNLSKTAFALFESTRDLCMLDLIISTGIRIGEAVAIRIDDIVNHEHLILIHGKGRKQRLLYVSSQDMWNNLKNWLRLRKELGIQSEYLFVNRYYDKISIYGVENIFSKYKKLAGINTKATPHFLRHTFATNLLINGADLRSVQDILGHAKISTTEIYTEVTMKRKKQVLSKYNYRNRL